MPSLDTISTPRFSSFHLPPPSYPSSLTPSFSPPSTMAGPSQGTDVKPPRPSNSWILYRAFMMKNLPPVGPGEPRRSQSDVSSLIGAMWRNADDDTRSHFERMADEVKAEHKRKFPDYKFQPKKKEDKERLREAQKQQRQAQKRDSRSRRGTARKSPPPPPPSLPQSVIQPAPHMPYYTPHLLYGMAGPSPPISAASSPSTLSDAANSPQVASLQLTPLNAASPAHPVHLPSTLTLPTSSAPIQQLPYPLQFASSSTSPVNVDASAWPSAPQTEETPVSSDAAQDNANFASVWDPTALELAQPSFVGSSVSLCCLAHSPYLLTI